MKKAAKPPSPETATLATSEADDLEKLVRVGCATLNADAPLEQVAQNTQRALQLIEKLKSLPTEKS